MDGLEAMQAAPHDVITRPAVPADHAAIAVLLRQLGYEIAPALVLRQLQALPHAAHDQVLVAALHGEVVGSISLHAVPMFHTGGFLGRITSLVVDERYRARGVGSALIWAAQRWFQAAGCAKLEVTSSDHRSGAHRFYEGHGFLRDGQRFARAFGAV